MTSSSRNAERKSSLNQETIRDILEYNEQTGEFFWKERPLKYSKSEGYNRSWNKRFSGKRAFTTKNEHGYYTTTILNTSCKAHRVAWMYTYGYWPEHLDHINGDVTDNRISNLREVSHKENVKNMKRFPSNKTGISGVYWCSDREKWVAKISVQSRSKHLGRFDDFFEACCARKSADRKYNFHENHGRR